MKLTTLDSGMFYRSIRYACHFLTEQREAINAINVFPVADGDTGDNMSATAKAIIFHAKESASLAETAQSIADSSVMGARGNSGMIFSQFFNGLSEAVADRHSLSTLQFSQAVSIACTRVREAIFNPVEGTILTIMEQWSHCLNAHCDRITCFKALFQHCFPILESTLQSTEQTLAALRKAHVVDAGALGFFHFIHGVAAFFENPTLEIDHNAPEEICIQHEPPAADNPPDKRYCTEAVIINQALNKHSLAELLETHGDSIVMTSNPRLCRFHLHCNAPWKLFANLQALGAIQYPKVDDMLRQYQAVHQQKYRIALVTDSSANLSESLMNEYQVHTIPLNVHIDEHDLLDQLCLNTEHLYHILEKTRQYPTTSSPSPGLVRDKLRVLSEHYDEVLVISIAKALSATHDAIQNAAQPFKNVHVFDSRQVSGGQGLLIHKAGQYIAQGLCGVEIIKQLEHDRAQVRLFVMVEKLDSMVRSGRVSKLKGKIAQLTGIKPIVTLDELGKAAIHDKAFSSNKALAKMIETVAEIARTTPLQAYAIVHAAAPEMAQQLSELTTKALGQKPLFIESVSTAIGLHAGKGCVAITSLFGGRHDKS